MARMKKCFLGYPSGKIGDLVFKIRNDKIFVSAAPEFRKTSVSSGQKTCRKNFSICNLFASALKNIDILYRRWGEVDIDAENEYLKIMKINLENLNKNGLSSLKLLPDEDYFSPELKSWSYYSNTLEVKCRIPEGVKTGFSLSLQGVAIGLEPLVPTEKDHCIIPLYMGGYNNPGDEEVDF
jgi:hypothetical protein